MAARSNFHSAARHRGPLLLAFIRTRRLECGITIYLTCACAHRRGTLTHQYDTRYAGIGVKESSTRKPNNAPTVVLSFHIVPRTARQTLQNSNVQNTNRKLCAGVGVCRACVCVCVSVCVSTVFMTLGG